MLRIVECKADQRVRLANRQRLQQERVDDAEQGDVGPDAEREGSQGDGGDDGCAEPLTEGVEKVGWHGPL